MTPPLLEFQRVSFAYGLAPKLEPLSRSIPFPISKPILDAASFTLLPDDCTALIGPNGIGKTTLLRLASGALQPTSGTILLRGRPLAAYSARQIARLVAVVPQQLEVPFQYTVEQLVEQGRTPYLGLLRGPSHADRLAVDRALDLANATTLRHRIFNELSGGERQRVKIALGLAQQPALLLLDEPTQNLDIGRQVELLDLLHHLRSQGIAILASMHDLHLIEDNFADVLLLSLEPGLRAGTPQEILNPVVLEEAFCCPPGRHPLFSPAGRQR